jgi:hypothetical protein
VLLLKEICLKVPVYCCCGNGCSLLSWLLTLRSISIGSHSCGKANIKKKGVFAAWQRDIALGNQSNGASQSASALANQSTVLKKQGKDIWVTKSPSLTIARECQCDTITCTGKPVHDCSGTKEKPPEGGSTWSCSSSSCVTVTVRALHFKLKFVLHCVCHELQRFFLQVPTRAMASVKF